MANNRGAPVAGQSHDRPPEAPSKTILLWASEEQQQSKETKFHVGYC
jgi:hypothetical protein